MTFPALANTFKALADNGKKGFYEGRIAEAIIDLISSKGGVMTLTDLSEHKTEFVEPIKYTYCDAVTVYEVTFRSPIYIQFNPVAELFQCAPNGQG